MKKLLGELLETYGRNTKAISSEANENHKSSLNVQRLTLEQVSNNSDTSAEHPNRDDDIVRYPLKGGEVCLNANPQQ